ncbi:carboxylating nicotinate-nucleotide diphosphorylase [Mailhella massiliensis]|uniref:carboxylating nicotinate-nucleotide diphosphorylase n=1 Tax=Mailhella massiliensis TaxID=1903261 RepID=UPI002356634C|nr:carboxylating nicotinate-nucleotide diphosphorylase [Mailhella massiliensis]
MSKDDFEYHAHAAGASSNMAEGSGLFVEGVAVPADTAAVFSETACAFAVRLIRMALDEDGPDLTSLGIFPPEEEASAYIVAKQRTLVVGLPLISLVLAVTGMPSDAWHAEVREGDLVENGTVVARLHGRTVQLLKAERIILNLMTHLSGVADLTREYVLRLEGTGVRLLDTRKTLPGHRYLEKYAVRVAGGCNHRMNLGDMLMIKDNHIDAAGSIAGAVKALRDRYRPCPPIEVECRNRAEVLEAVESRPDRILLDNMNAALLAEVLPLIPRDMEAEISGGVTLETIRDLALACRERPADFISVGRITHSAPSADFSMKMERGV